MRHSSSSSIFFLIAVSVIVIILYVVLTTMQIPVGNIIDWITGIVAFWWLTGITTLPWNMYFVAKDVLDEARITESKGKTPDASDIHYAKKQGKVFLSVAIILHIVSAAGLYALAYFGISSIGYFAAGIALGLTFVRPLQRLYEYVVQRLYRIKDTLLYPREDVFELKDKLREQGEQIDTLIRMLNLSEKESWAHSVDSELKILANKTESLNGSLSLLKQENDKAHAELSTQTREEITKLSEDSRFLNQARELIKFIKNA
jgi:hypothetical protein